jgi:hypothetical protein
VSPEQNSFKFSLPKRQIRALADLLFKYMRCEFVTVEIMRLLVILYVTPFGLLDNIKISKTLDTFNFKFNVK